MDGNVANIATNASKNVAHLENDRFDVPNYVRDMLSKWLQEALARDEDNEQFISQTELAKRLTETLGKSVDRAAVNKMLRGTRSISGEELIAISNITGHPVPGLSRNDTGDVQLRPGEDIAPVVGWVQAGVWQEVSFDMKSLDWPDEFRVVRPHPKYPNVEYNVFEVRGDSFNKVAPEGSHVVAIPWPQTGLLAPLNRQVIIAEQSAGAFDGETSDVYNNVQRTLKRVRVEGGTTWLEPESTNSYHQPIELTGQTRAAGLVVSVIQDLEV